MEQKNNLGGDAVADWWDYLDWETMENTWWRFPETVRKQLREKGINPSYDSSDGTNIEENEL